MDFTNKFFVKLEDALHWGKTHISFATHVPKTISPEDALNLAAHLVKQAAGKDATPEQCAKLFEPYAKAIIGKEAEDTTEEVELSSPVAEVKPLTDEVQ